MLFPTIATWWRGNAGRGPGAGFRHQLDQSGSSAMAVYMRVEADECLLYCLRLHTEQYENRREMGVTKANINISGEETRRDLQTMMIGAACQREWDYAVRP